MARPIFNHELLDPDFAWLLTTFKENNPEVVSLECFGMAVVMIKLTEEEYHRTVLPYNKELEAVEKATSAKK